jgi:hypothetical protein
MAFNKYGLLLFVVIALANCTNPSSIGTDFIGTDLISVTKVDSLAVQARTVAPGAINVYQNQSNLSRYLCGNLRDDYFGMSRSEIYGQLRVRDNTRDFNYSSIDSVVLSLRYDSTSFYGNWMNEEFDIEVFRLSESIDAESDYRSDTTFMSEAAPIGQRMNVKAEPSEPVVILFEDSDGEIDTVTVAPQLRIPIDARIGEEILAYDSLALSDNEVFLESFKGVKIAVESENTMLAFRLITPETRMIVYYRNEADEPAEMNLSFTDRSAVVPNFSHEFDGSISSSFVDQPQLGDSLIFTQSMAGIEAEIELPDLSDWDHLELNNASLSFTLAPDLPDNLTNLFPPAEQVTAIRTNEEGEIRLLTDAVLAESQAGSREFLEAAFGGFIQEVEQPNGPALQKYTISITQFVERVRTGEIDPVLRIRPRLKNVTAGRSIILGPGHSEYPMKFTLVFSTP